VCALLDDRAARLRIRGARARCSKDATRRRRSWRG
jgi:hypothetical protein